MIRRNVPRAVTYDRVDVAVTSLAARQADCGDLGGVKRLKLRFVARGIAATAVALLAVLALGTALAQADEPRERLDGKLRFGPQIVVPAGETAEGDLVAFGGEVRVDGVVEGDVVASGGQITVNGPVAGDVLAAGGSVRVGGDVGGDVRVASGETMIAGEVGEDVLAATGDVRLTSGSVVAGDVIVSAGQLRVDGTVDGSVVGRAGDYAVAGTVGGVEDIRVGEDAGPPAAGERALSALGRYIGLLLVAGLLLGVAPAVLRGSETRLRQRPWTSLGVGAAGLVGGGIAALIVLVAGILLAGLFAVVNLGALAAASAFGGFLTAALIVFGLSLAAAFVSQLVVGLWLGRLAVRLRADVSRWRVLGALALGLLVVTVLGAIPILGGFVSVAVVVVGLGAFLGWVWQRRRPAATAAEPAPPEPIPAPPSI